MVLESVQTPVDPVKYNEIAPALTTAVLPLPDSKGVPILQVEAL